VGPSDFVQADDNVSFSGLVPLHQLNPLVTQPGIMSEHGSDKNTSPPGYDMACPCEEILQNISDGHLTAAEAALKLAAITIPDPKSTPKNVKNISKNCGQSCSSFRVKPRAE